MDTGSALETDRRGDRRLAIKLPLECRAGGLAADHALRGMTANISTGGLYFEAELANGTLPFGVNDLLDVTLTVPPGEGHFPYEGRVQSVVQVLRQGDLPPPNGTPGGRRRVTIAAQFREPLKLAF